MPHRTSAAIRRRRGRWWIGLYLAAALALAVAAVRGLLRDDVVEVLRVLLTLVGLAALYRWTSGRLAGARTPSGSAWRLVVRRLAQSVFVYLAFLEIVHALIRLAPMPVFRAAIWSLSAPVVLALRALVTSLLEPVSRWFVISAGATAAAMTAMLFLLLEASMNPVDVPMLNLSALPISFLWFLGAMAVAIGSLVVALTRSSEHAA